MSELPRHVEQSIRARGLLMRGQGFLVAVSGGVDSMVLMQVLHDLAPAQGWRLIVAHMNHALRGQSSDADERLVRRAAETLKLPVRVERADVRRFARAHGFSLEMAARKVRHDFLARTAAQLGIRSIGLGHQADDQLELFLLRLFRGSSGEGLAGMRWRNPSPSNRKIELVRPLLDQPRSVLLEYASQAGIRFREDASNASLDIQRNRIRGELLPLLRAKYQPALSKIILRTADILGADAEFAAQAASAWLSRRLNARPSGRRDVAQVKMGCPGFPDPSAPFEKLPVAVQRRIIQLQLLRQGIAPDYSLIEELRCTANKPVTIGPVQQANTGDSSLAAWATGLPDASRNSDLRDDSDTVGESCPFTAVRDQAGILHLQMPKTELFKSDSIQVTLRGGAGQAHFAGVIIRWQVNPSRGDCHLPPAKGRESFDADRVGSSIRLRHWQPGDRFQPIGMPQPVKLQDFFTNQKVPPGGVGN